MQRRPQSADQTFCRLLADIVLARDVELRIKRGLVDREHTDIVQELERRAWEHLAAYVGAMAFALDTGEDNEQRREIES
jgi:hypothetical protein